MTEVPPNIQFPKAAEPQLRFRGARAVAALVLREMTTTYGRSPGGYVWAILQPVAVLVVLTIAFSFLLRTPSLGNSFILFYASGYLILRMFQEVAGSVGAALSFNKALLAYPCVTFVDAIAARALLAAMTQVLVSIIIMCGIFLFEDIRLSMDFGPIIIAYISAAVLGLGVGMFNCFMMLSFPIYSTVWGIVTRPLILISAVIYIIEDLPGSAQKILWYNPLAHLTGLNRTGVFTTYDPSYISLLYVFLFAAIPMFFGVLFLRRFSKDAFYK